MTCQQIRNRHLTSPHTLHQCITHPAAEVVRPNLGHPKPIYVHRYRNIGTPSIFGNKKSMLPTRSLNTSLIARRRARWNNKHEDQLPRTGL